jgi:hypothetical protein
MESSGSWYTLVQGDDLEQGDILLNLPLIELPADLAWPQQEGAEIEQTPLIHSVNAIIMSQSCDLQHPGKLKFVAFCPIYELHRMPQFPSKNHWNNLRQGRIVSYHLLNRCSIEGHETDFWVVEFTRIASLPIGLTRRLAGEQGLRLRLLSPYKEHLSQSFARFFMRVGLPSDIPEFS